MSESAPSELLSELVASNRVVHRRGHGTPSVPGAALIGLWILFPLALAGLAVVVVGLALLLESHRTAPDLVLDWRPWLFLTLILQAGYWSVIAHLGGRNPLNGLWAVLPALALVPTFFIARDALVEGRKAEIGLGSGTGDDSGYLTSGGGSGSVLSADIQAAGGVPVGSPSASRIGDAQAGSGRTLRPIAAVAVVGVLLFLGTALAILNAKPSLRDCLGEPDIVKQQSDYLAIRQDQEAAYQEFASGRLSYAGYREYVVRLEEADRSLSTAIAACLST